jgi:hypothetical protein
VYKRIVPKLRHERVRLRRHTTWSTDAHRKKPT